MKSKFYFAAIGAYVIWGFFSLVVKPMHIYRPIDIVFYRVFMCALLMLAFNLIFRRQVLRENYALFKASAPRLRNRSLLLTLSGGMMLVANWLFFIYVMNHISIKAASFAYLVCPILTTVLTFVLLAEQLSRIQWMAVSLSLVSCILLSFNSISDTLYSLVVALSYAFYLITQRKNVGYDRFLVLTLQLCFGALLLLPFFPHFGSDLFHNSTFQLQILVVALGFTILPLFLNLYSLQGLNSSTVGILLYINPLINFVIALLYFHEEVNALQMVAYLIIALSIVLFNKNILFKRLATLRQQP